MDSDTVITDKSMENATDDSECDKLKFDHHPEISTFNRDLAIFAVVLSCIYVLSMAALYTYVRPYYSYLYRRNYVLVMLTCVGWLHPLVLLGREIQGREHFNCFLLSFSKMFSINFVFVPYFLRVMSFYFRVQKRRIIAEESYFNSFETARKRLGLKDTFVNFYDLHDKVPKTPTGLIKNLRSLSGPIFSSKSSNKVFTQLSDEDGQDGSGKSYVNLSKTDTTVTGSSEPSAEFKRISFFATQRFAIYLFLANILLTVAFSPVGFKGELFCFGCEISIASNIMTFCFAGVILILILGSFYAVRNEPDPLMIAMEIKLAFLTATGIGTIWMLLASTDPGNLYKNGKFSWTYFALLAYAAGFTASFPLQIYKAYTMRKTVDVSPQSLSEFDKIMKSKIGLGLFKAHLIEELSFENYMFLNDITVWKEMHDSSSVKPSDVVRHGFKLFNTYIAEDAPLSLNISFTSKRDIISKFEDVKDGTIEDFYNKISDSVFDNVFKEVKFLMATDSFARFKQTKRYQTLYQKGDLVENEDVFLKKNSL